MLDRQTLPPPGPRPETDPIPPDSDFISHRDIRNFIRIHRFTIVAALALGLGIAAFYVWTAKPSYTARAQLLIDPNTSGVSETATTAQRISLDAAQVASEVAVLQSEAIAMKVVRKLGLVNDPEFVSAEPSLFSQVKSLVLGGGGRQESALPDFIRERIAIAAFQGRLDVRRSGLSYAIDIAFSSSDPDKAARIANTVAEAYIEDQLETRAESAKQTSERLLARNRQLRLLFNEAAQDLKSFRAGRPAVPDVPGPPATPGGASDSVQSLEVLEATVNAYRMMYEGAFRAYSEAEQRRAFPFSDARILTEATRPLGKSHPRTALILILGTFSGLLIGLGVAFLQHNFDGSVRSVQQLRQRTGLPCLARIPRIGSPPRPWEHLLRFRSRPALRNFRRVSDEPFSPFTGAIKALKAAILRSGAQRDIRTIGITSVLPHEGKSTIAGNLATVLAAGPHRTLLIDADIHFATVSRVLAPKATAGLLEVLSGSGDLQTCLIPATGKVPAVLPVVIPKKNAISYELLSSPRMVEMLRVLREHFDIILIDMPPLTPVADAMSISSVLDGVLLVAAWRETPLDLLAEVAHGLTVAEANVLGTVLTKVDEVEDQVRLRRSRPY